MTSKLWRASTFSHPRARFCFSRASGSIAYRRMLVSTKQAFGIKFLAAGQVARNSRVAGAAQKAVQSFQLARALAGLAFDEQTADIARHALTGLGRLDADPRGNLLVQRDG